MDWCASRMWFSGTRGTSSYEASSSKGCVGEEKRMPRIADYAVVRSAPFDLGPGEESNAMTFTIHSDLVENGNEGPVLSYQCRPLSDQGAALRIDISGDSIESVTISVNTVRAMWKTFAGSLLHPGLGADNNIKFRNTGSGSIRVSDVIIWYQRNIQ